MKKVHFDIKKWAVRAMVTAGAMLGITSCCIFRPHSHPNPAEAVYGPPPNMKPHKAEVLEDVYGPPIEEFDSSSNGVVLEPEKPVGTNIK